MIKYYCNRCNKEIKDNSNQRLCEECYNLLYEYDFQVGDEVITSIGEVGIIDYICKCVHCKERGFYEPHVISQGSEFILITNNSKENGFKNFYKIGKYTFGNINIKGAQSAYDYACKNFENAKIKLEKATNALSRVKKLSEKREN